MNDLCFKGWVCFSPTLNSIAPWDAAVFSSPASFLTLVCDSAPHTVGWSHFPDCVDSDREPPNSVLANLDLMGSQRMAWDTPTVVSKIHFPHLRRQEAGKVSAQ